MESTIYRLENRHILILCVLGLLFLGIAMVQSAAINVTGQVGWHWTERGSRHIVYAAVALVTFFAMGRLDYAVLARRSLWTNPVLWGLAGAISLCAVVLVPHVGISRNGARRWLPLGFVQVQPSELAKWMMVLFLAWWLTYRPVDVRRLGGFLLTLVPVGVICLLVVMQDFGTAALIGLCAMVMLLAGRVRWRHLGAVLVPACAAAGWFLMHKEYRWRRVVAFVDPWASPETEGYHMVQSLLGFASGGLSGRGLGNGVQKLGYLPEDTTDFIFSVICEELGLFGALLTIALYGGILYVVWQVMRQRRDSFARLLAFGTGAMLGLQAAINIAVATVSVPPKGLSLPLVSAGGSGLVITCAALGLLFSIARRERPGEAIEPIFAQWQPRWRWPEAGRMVRGLAGRVFANRGPRVVTEAMWRRFTV